MGSDKDTLLTASFDKLKEHAKLSTQLQADIGWICLCLAKEAGFKSLPELLHYIKQRKDLESKAFTVKFDDGTQYIPTR